MTTQKKSKNIVGVKNTKNKVGYKNPPPEFQFKKGQSGNPNGRPKGAKNKNIPFEENCLINLILQEAYRNIDVREEGRKKSYSTIRAILRSLSLKSIKGDTKAQKLFTDLLSAAEEEKLKTHLELLDNFLSLKHSGYQKIEHAKKSGKPVPQIIPHPDDIIINPRTGHIAIDGPFTKDEKVALEFLESRIVAFKKELKHLQNEYPKTKIKKNREILKLEIEQTEDLIGLFQECIDKAQYRSDWLQKLGRDYYKMKMNGAKK